MDKSLRETICLLGIHSSIHFKLFIQLSVMGEYRMAMWTNSVIYSEKWYNRCYGLTEDKSTVKHLTNYGIMGEGFYCEHA